MNPYCQFFSHRIRVPKEWWAPLYCSRCGYKFIDGWWRK